MKKGTKIVIVSLIIIWTISVLLCCGIIINYYENSSKTPYAFKESEDEIIEIFKKNKDMFVGSAEKLYEFKYHWTLRWRNQYGKGPFPREDWKYEYLNNRIELTIHSKKNFQDMPFIKAVADDTVEIEGILKELKFELISTEASVDSNCIYFVKQTLREYDSGIVYCPENLPQNPYVTKLTEIEPSWYYYDSK